MGKRSQRVPVRFWATLAVISLTSPALVRAARVPGYLEVVGPTPLRFEVKPTPLVVVPETNTPPAVVVVKEAAPVVAPEPRAPTATLPEAIRALLGSPLWATLAESVLAELGSNFFKALPPAPAPAPEPPQSQTVTAEMLTDFFKSAAPAANTTNSTALPVPVFVLPSSQATYRTP